MTKDLGVNVSQQSACDARRRIIQSQSRITTVDEGDNRYTRNVVDIVGGKKIVKNTHHCGMMMTKRTNVVRLYLRHSQAALTEDRI